MHYQNKHQIQNSKFNRKFVRTIWSYREFVVPFDLIYNRTAVANRPSEIPEAWATVRPLFDLRQSLCPRKAECDYALKRTNR